MKKILVFIIPFLAQIAQSQEARISGFDWSSEKYIMTKMEVMINCQGMAIDSIKSSSYSSQDSHSWQKEQKGGVLDFSSWQWVSAEISGDNSPEGNFAVMVYKYNGIVPGTVGEYAIFILDQKVSVMRLIERVNDASISSKNNPISLRQPHILPRDNGKEKLIPLQSRTNYLLMLANRLTDQLDTSCVSISPRTANISKNTGDVLIPLQSRTNYLLMLANRLTDQFDTSCVSISPRTANISKNTGDVLAPIKTNYVARAFNLQRLLDANDSIFLVEPLQTEQSYIAEQYRLEAKKLLGAVYGKKKIARNLNEKAMESFDFFRGDINSMTVDPGDNLSLVTKEKKFSQISNLGVFQSPSNMALCIEAGIYSSFSTALLARAMLSDACFNSSTGGEKICYSYTGLVLDVPQILLFRKRGYNLKAGAYASAQSVYIEQDTILLGRYDGGIGCGPSITVSKVIRNRRDLASGLVVGIDFRKNLLMREYKVEGKISYDFPDSSFALEGIYTKWGIGTSGWKHQENSYGLFFHFENRLSIGLLRSDTILKFPDWDKKNASWVINVAVNFRSA